ncbi:restriction endonuclease subunit S [Elizabethkingia sp. M8]|uniref:restriction endonuclease subunit S n=1 Tax=Elizabethkingia sp. M8 TaxID=2796140 RepID=UPI001904A7CE|nr:restriction endonuclease subunit S [Elizabethkingia sp. M8]QQM25385.1 restriction endonuclease subunit S [Elizabethkingia sp. M8]
MRFPNFYGEWEVKKLGEIGEIVNGLTYSPNDIAENGVLVLRSSNVQNRNLAFEDNVYVRTDNYNPVQENDILICVRNGSKNLIGKNALINKENEGVAFGAFMSIYRSSFNRFLFHWFDTNQYKEVVHKNLGATINSINGSDLRKFKVPFPSIKEQTKISSFLSKIDERIQTQSKIIEGLKKLKVATAKKIFSQEFRFKDDKGNDFSEWEEILLGEVMSIPEKTKAQNIDKNKLLTVKLHLKGVLKNDNTDTLSFGATNYFIRKKGQFIYGKQNLFNGAFDIIPDEFDGFLSSGDVPTLEINNSKINSSFLLYLMGRKEFYKPLEDFATGSGSKRIHEKTLLGIKIPFPSLPEQTKIANFLSAIDSKIDIESQLLQKLEEQKKFLLQNMFV